MGWEVGRSKRKVPLYSTILILIDLSPHLLKHSSGIGPRLNIPESGCCGEHVEGYCVSNTTNRIRMSVSDFDKRVTIYPNTNKSFNIGPFEFSHSHGSLKVLIKYVTGPEVNGCNITCTDINGGVLNMHVY